MSDPITPPTTPPTQSLYLDIVFDGPPGPVAGRFVEVETDRGESISLGEWVQRKDGYWVLRIPPINLLDDIAEALEEQYNPTCDVCYGQGVRRVKQDNNVKCATCGGTGRIEHPDLIPWKAYKQYMGAVTE